jgi:5-(carboxyamino)imidazole ribonucleotide mutase
MSKVIIIMGSKSDFDWAKKIVQALDKFGIKPILRIASAHKVPLKCYELIKSYEDDEGEPIVFITVAGRSNALSGFTDAQTIHPVIACPPYGEKFAGADIYSSLRMPTGVAPMVVLEPENTALAAAKILAVADDKIRAKVKSYQDSLRAVLEEHDREISSEEVSG